MMNKFFRMAACVAVALAITEINFYDVEPYIFNAEYLSDALVAYYRLFFNVNVIFLAFTMLLGRKLTEPFLLTRTGKHTAVFMFSRGMTLCAICTVVTFACALFWGIVKGAEISADFITQVPILFFFLLSVYQLENLACLISGKYALSVLAVFLLLLIVLATVQMDFDFMATVRKPLDHAWFYAATNVVLGGITIAYLQKKDFV